MRVQETRGESTTARVIVLPSGKIKYTSISINTFYAFRPIRRRACDGASLCPSLVVVPLEISVVVVVVCPRESRASRLRTHDNT